MFFVRLQSPASKALIIDKDGTGYTPVHYAARAGYLQVCKDIYISPGEGHNNKKKQSNDCLECWKTAVFSLEARRVPNPFSSKESHLILAA